MEKGKMRTNG